MPTINFMHGQTVQFVQRQVAGVDGYGNDVYGNQTQSIDGCVISPGNSNEDFQGTLQISSDVTVHCPVGTVINVPVDRMILPDGSVYNVIGSPKNWASPFTGTGSVVEVQGRLVTTGGAAT
jgi:hypothetical protein